MHIPKIITDNIQFIQVISIIIIIILVIYSSKSMLENFEHLRYSAFTSKPIMVSTQDDTIEPEMISVKPIGDEGSQWTSPVDLKHEDDIMPEDLLPKGESDMPDLSAKNFLTSGFSVGINTNTQSNRNANYQLRSDPYIPQNLGATPFNQSTLAPDVLRKSFDIGN